MTTNNNPAPRGDGTYLYPGTTIRLNAINVTRPTIKTRGEVEVMKKLVADGDDYLTVSLKMGTTISQVSVNLKNERPMPKSGHLGDSHGDASHNDLFGNEGLIEN